MAKSPWYAQLSTQDRIKRAKEITSNLVDHVSTAIWHNESNRILVFSDAISKQIRPSRAFNTFNMLVYSQFEFEILRLCKIWDTQSEDRESIYSAIQLIDNTDVITNLSNACAMDWPNEPIFGSVQAKRVRVMLKSAICTAKKAKNCERMMRMRAFRNENIAHILKAGTETAKIPTAMKNGDGKWLLDRTIRIVDWLNLGVCGCSFDWQGTRKMGKRNAEFFWKGITVKVLG